MMEWDSKDENILVVFGAGASFDIVRGTNGIPTTDRLFTEQVPIFSQALNKAPNRQAKEIIDVIDENFRSTPNALGIESLLFESLKRSEKSLRTKKALLAFRYFLKDLIGLYAEHVNAATPVTNNYVRIIRKLAHWQDESQKELNFVTFNYEALLDAALNDVFGLHLGEVTAGMDAYTENDFVKLFRPHGCIKWYRQADYLGAELFSDKAIENLDLNNRPINLRRSLQDGENDVPALAIPFKERKQFEWPDRHLEKFTSIIPKTRKVFLIGWRAAEPHFIELIKESLNPEARWIIVAGSVEGGEEVRKNLESLMIRNTFRYDKGFSDFVNDAEFDRELKEIL